MGKFEASRPEELVRLLRTIAERRVCDATRFWRAQRRDLRREADLGEVEEMQLATAGPTPSRTIAEQDLIATALTRLPEDTRQVTHWRQEGLGWEQIARRLPGRHDARSGSPAVRALAGTHRGGTGIGG